MRAKKDKLIAVVQSDRSHNIELRQVQNSYVKAFSIIALCILTIGINSLGQKPDSNWEISFGRSWGRFHQHIEKQTVDSNGSITYLNRRNGTPAIGQISGPDVDEITELLKRLKLNRAKSIPSKDFNKCIVSPHMPNSYFSLTQGGREYSLSPCKEYGYTLILSDGQKAIYERLRARIESLFEEEMKKQAI